MSLSESLLKEDIKDGLHDRVFAVDEICIENARSLGVFDDINHARSIFEGRLDCNGFLDGSQYIYRLA